MLGSFDNASAAGHISFGLMLLGLSIRDGAPVLNWN